MGNYDHEPGSVDWLDLGPDPDEGRTPADPRRRYLWYAAAAGLVVVALLLARTQQGTNRAATSPSSPSRTASSSPASSSPASSGSFVNPTPTSGGPSAGLTAAPQGGPAKVTSLGHRLLDAPADWELFALGQGVVIRIQLALGRITTTPVPMSISEVPAMFFVGSDRVFVRAPDDSTGYVVRDGKLPVELPPSLQRGFYMLPSTDQHHLWVNQLADNLGGALELVNLDGKPTGITIDVPENGSVLGSDGAGYALLASIGGLYDARPGSVHRITTGPLLASGPTRWLAVECDDSLSCANVVIDRATRARHRLTSPIISVEPTGTISPDGKTAALFLPSDGISGNGIQLLDLDSGAGLPVNVTLSSTDSQLAPQLVWSPDSRWLFVTDAAGRVIIINRGTGRATPLGARLAEVTQLALRHSAS